MAEEQAATELHLPGTVAAEIGPEEEKKKPRKKKNNKRKKKKKKEKEPFSLRNVLHAVFAPVVIFLMSFKVVRTTVRWIIENRNGLLGAGFISLTVLVASFAIFADLLSLTQATISDYQFKECEVYGEPSMCPYYHLNHTLDALPIRRRLDRTVCAAG
mmetsp:Transcript_40050/g.64102  ORF Transcript_40050/g.64102 Transcript_40050/m.64102 type:complete len:158 (-) Transcript_40050:146-619(-)